MQTAGDSDIIPLTGASHPETDASFRGRLYVVTIGAPKDDQRTVMIGTGLELDAVGLKYGLARHPRAWC